MKTSAQGFALVSLSVHLFALPTVFNKVVWEVVLWRVIVDSAHCMLLLLALSLSLSLQHSLCLTVPLVLGTIRLLMDVSYMATCLYIAVISAMVVFFPLWLYSLQDLKKLIFFSILSPFFCLVILWRMVAMTTYIIRPQGPVHKHFQNWCLPHGHDYGCQGNLSIEVAKCPATVH